MTEASLEAAARGSAEAGRGSAEARGPAAAASHGPAALRERAAGLFPGGVNSPVRAFRAVGGEPPIITGGHGALVRDVDGRELLDYIGAFGPLILGHADDRVVAAVHRAAADGGPFGATVPDEIQLGELIRERMPSIERLRFVSSGTEAAMSALRVARAATGRPLILKFEGGYHGHSDGLLAAAGSGLATFSLPASAGVTAEVAAQTVLARYNDLDSVRAAFTAHPAQVAAVIVEPVAANMGVVAPVPGFLDGLREIASANGALLVFDEVITGFRVAPGGAQQRYGVTPDLTVLGKIIGGGLPVGAYGGRAELMDLVAPNGPVYQAGTLSGHPVAMAAGLANLRALDAAAYARLEAVSARLESILTSAIATSPSPARLSVARVGSLLTLFFRAAAPRDFDEAQECDTAAFARFHRAMFRRGVLLPPSQHEAWFVSLAHDDERAAEWTTAALSESLAVLA